MLTVAPLTADSTPATFTTTFPTNGPIGAVGTRMSTSSPFKPTETSASSADAAFGSAGSTTALIRYRPSIPVSNATPSGTEMTGWTGLPVSVTAVTVAFGRASSTPVSSLGASTVTLSRPNRLITGSYRKSDPRGNWMAKAGGRWNSTSVGSTDSR